MLSREAWVELKRSLGPTISATLGWENELIVDMVDFS
jgi:hypothetical protein